MIEYADEVIKKDKIAWFDGLKFVRDDKTGYYLNSINAIRLHRAVWQKVNGEIPSGYDIHHIDHDKSNNNIDNLQMMTKSDHMRLHGKTLKDKWWYEDFQSKGVEAAKEWHKSNKGREWHEEHYQNMKEKLHEEVGFECEQCGISFVGVDNGQNRFCSNKCKSAFRRASGVDDEERVCKQCGDKFTVNKYAKTVTCSKSCSNKLFPRLTKVVKTSG